MPYIPTDRRGDMAMGSQPGTEGEFNYAITCIIDKIIGKTPSYAHINAAIGVLECAKLELYRRIAAPYEDKKQVVNGEVYSSLKGK